MEIESVRGNKMEKKSGRMWRSVICGLIILFILGVIAVAVYPFDNRNLHIKFKTDAGIYVDDITNLEIAETGVHELIFENVSSIKIDEITVYGSFMSMPLKEIPSGSAGQYVGSVRNGEMTWEDGKIKASGKGTVNLIMSDAYGEMLHKLSASFLQERIVFVELWFAVIAFAFLICNVIKEKKEENSWYNHGPVYEVKKFFSDMKEYGQYMVYAARTDLKAEVANSYLNRLWWLLEPLFNMMVYVIVFGNIMSRSIENYATFVFSALLMWNFFNKTITYSLKLIRNNKGILTKVYIPKFVLLFSNMILNLFKLSFSMIVLVVMLFVFKVHIGVNVLWVIPSYLATMLLAFGAGMIFMHFGVYVDDLAYAIGILLNMLMFLSGIFYNTMTSLSEPINTIIMTLNPVAIFVDTMRNALLYNTVRNVPVLAIWFLISIILCCIGVHTVYKNENSYIKVV